MNALKRSEEKFTYYETLVSDGIPRMINFRARNRRIIRAWTYDKHMIFTSTEESVFINGPAGTEVMVSFIII